MDRVVPKTLHLVEYLDQGGVERMLDSLARHTPRDRAALVFFSYESETLTGIGKQLAGRGFPVFHGRKAPGYDLRLVARLFRIVQDEGITTVHTHDFGPMEYAAALKLRFPRLRLVHTQHTLHHFVTERRYKLFFQAVSPLYNAIACVSEHGRRELRRHCPLVCWRLRTIHNGVDSDSLAATPNKGGQDGRLRIVSVSRISPEKNLLYTLEACRTLKWLGVPFTFHHAGSGTRKEEARVKKFVARHGLSRDVHFHGFLDDVRPVLAEGDVFVSSSQTEGHPVAVLEAMASGKICVLSDIPPHRELSRDALVFFPLEKGALGRRLADLSRELRSHRAYGEKARAEASERFSIRSTVEEYCRLYEA